jgi:CheY-like chemotaxis protein
VPQTLLLADDSVTIQRVIELTFADEDIDVVAVSDGDQAIARIDALPPDIVLVDVGMPGKSGYDVAAYVKHTPKLAHIPVVLLTGAFEPVDQARATAAGCDGVLAKPFEPQMVIGRVKELLRRPVGQAGMLDDVFAAPAAPRNEAWPAFAAAHPADEGGSGSKKIDDYFDQLDAAFTNLAGKPPAVAPVRDAPPLPIDVDWFGLQPAARPDDAAEVSIQEQPGQPFWAGESSDLSMTPSTQVEQPPAPEHRAAEEPPPPQPDASSSLPAASSSLPPLADAFAALLEAEQGQPQPAARPAWPSSAGAGAVVTDDLVERVSQRVLEQLTDRAIREAVSERVSAIAERLIREEIERIKGSIS